MIVKQSR
jgi:hypothetical protein